MRQISGNYIHIKQLDTILHPCPKISTAVDMDNGFDYIAMS